MSEVEELGFGEARKLILKMAELKNRLKELGVIRSESNITAGYAEWFCSKKYGLDLILTSAKTGQNVEDAFIDLTKVILDKIQEN